MQNPNKIWTPARGKQTEVLSRSETEILIGGSRGGGKSELGIAFLGEQKYIEHPKYRALVIRRDHDDLSDWVLRAKNFFGDEVKFGGKPIVGKCKHGGVIRCGHWKDRTTISKYIGHEYSKMLIEEITWAIYTLDEYKMILGSLRVNKELESQGLTPQLMASTNPGGRGHRWVKNYWVDLARNKTYIDPESGYSRIFIPVSHLDNPYLADSYKRWLDGLPEGLRRQWRDGDWDHFEGQLFGWFGSHNEAEPRRLEQSEMLGRLVGSLDGGTSSHKTSFGLWWVSPNNKMYRLFTYCAGGSTHAGHAREIFDRIESFTDTEGYFPDVIVADPALWTQTKVNEQMVRAPIDEYKDYFEIKQKHTIFEKANNKKENGCDVMQEVFKNNDGDSILKYWRAYNKSFEEDVLACPTDENNTRIYPKFDGDDTIDEARYGIVKCYSMLGHVMQMERKKKEKSHRELLLSGKLPHQTKRKKELSWKDM